MPQRPRSGRRVCAALRSTFTSFDARECAMGDQQGTRSPRSRVVL